MPDLSAVDLVGYIDAGTGSYLLAAIASGAAGLWMFFRSGLMKVRRKIRGEQSESPPLSESNETESESGESIPRG